MRPPPVLLALLLLAPLATGQAGELPRGPDVVLVVYHPHPDPRAGAPDADPLSSPLAPAPAALEGLPATLVDGAFLADPAPEGRPESAPARFREVQRLVTLRERTASPLAAELSAQVDGDALVARVTLAPRDGIESVPVAVRFVLVEDGVPLTTETGVATRRFVARAVADGGEHHVEGATEADARLPLQPSWGRSRLGVVAVVTATTDGPTWSAGEVVQTVSLAPGVARAARSTHAVLVEHATATWCEACVPADEAIALLAAQESSGPVVAAGAARYWRGLDPLAVVGALAGLALGLALLRRRPA